MNDFVLRINDLSVNYYLPGRTVNAVDGISLDVERGERFGLVGESGSGKSTAAMAVLGLLRKPSNIVNGDIIFISHDNHTKREISLLDLSGEQMRQLRLTKIALIPQGAMNSLNPVIRIREQMIDGYRDHGIKMSKKEADKRVSELLDSVGLPDRVSRMYPHELSGGMKQRVAIAIATSQKPELIIADEPTSALDVVVQKQVMETIFRLQEIMKSTVLMIGHDMGLMAQSVNRLGVMKSGKLLETGSVAQIFQSPKNEYTKMLIQSIPTIKRQAADR